MEHHISNSLEETRNIASKWLSGVSGKYSNIDEALVVGLSGHLGAGKTAYVKAVAEELGIKEDVTSPTFVIMKIYNINSNKAPWKKLVHIDAYRLERREELEAIQWEKLVSDKENLVLVEWPENVRLSEFVDKAYIKFEIMDDKRTVAIL